MGVTKMKTKSFLAAFLFLVLLCVYAVPASPHHSWSGYDMAHKTTVKGTVTQFQWGNPHMWINFDVHDDKGAVENWSAGGPSPNRLANSGWDNSTLKPGDVITLVGNRIKDGTYSMKLESIVLADGRELYCGRGR
jgi:hypothetical protein